MRNRLNFKALSFFTVFMTLVAVGTFSTQSAHAKSFWKKAGRSLAKIGKSVAKNIVKNGVKFKVGPVEVVVRPRPAGLEVMSELNGLNVGETLEVAIDSAVDEAQILAPFAPTPLWQQILKTAQELEAAERGAILNILKQSEDALEAHYASQLPNGKLQNGTIFINSYRMVEQVAVLEGYLQLPTKKVDVSISVPVSNSL